MRYITFLLILSLGWVFAMPAQEAVLQELKGSVEIRHAGESWIPAEQGMVVRRDSTISTGFNSQAVLEIGDAVIDVQPLTRLSLAELSQRGSTTDTALSLRVGRIETEVRSAAGRQNNFEVRGPYSTAAVRGTRWTQTVTSVEVVDGTVAVYLGPPVGDQSGSGGSQEGDDGDAADDDDGEGDDGEATGEGESQRGEPVLVSAGGRVEVSAPVGRRRSAVRREDAAGDDGGGGPPEEAGLVSGEAMLQRQSATPSSRRPSFAPVADGGGADGTAGIVDDRGAAGPPRRPATTGSVSINWAW